MIAAGLRRLEECPIIRIARRLQWQSRATIMMRQRGAADAGAKLYAFVVPAKGHDFEAPARVYVPSRNSTHDNIKGLLQTVMEGLARKEVYTPRHNE